MENRTYCVYKHTSPNGKAYIGLTKDYKQRCKRHQMENNGCRAFSSAIQKHGWGNFQHEILLFGLTKEEAVRHEKTCITLHKTITPGGYNLTTGGEHPVVSDETRERQSKALSGLKRTPKQIEKIRKAKLGTKATAETKAKLSEAQRGRKHSPETREKMRQSATGRKMSPESVEKSRIAKIGLKRAPEAIEKTRQANLGRKCPPDEVARRTASIKLAKAKNKLLKEEK